MNAMRSAPASARVGALLFALGLIAAPAPSGFAEEAAPPPAPAAAATAPGDGPRPAVVKACTDARTTPGSADFERCTRGLEEMLKPGPKTPAPPGVTWARLAPGMHLPDLCARYYGNEFHGALIPGDVVGREYPMEKIRGDLTLLLYVATDGRVRNVLITESSGEPRLDAVTVSCLLDRVLRFKPQSENGTPVGAWTKLRYHWRIS